MREISVLRLATHDTDRKTTVPKVILYPGEDAIGGGMPSLPGCISQGKTKSEAKANIREAIEGYEAALEDIE